MNTQEIIEKVMSKNQITTPDLFLILQPNTFIDSGNSKRIEERISMVQSVVEDLTKTILTKGAKVATMVATNDGDVKEQEFTGDFNKIKQSTAFGYGLYSSFLPCDNVRKIILSTQKPLITVLITDGWLYNTEEAIAVLESHALADNNHLVIVSLNHPNADLGVLPHDKIFLDRLEEAGAEVYREDTFESLINKIGTIVKGKWISADNETDSPDLTSAKADTNSYITSLFNMLLDVALQLTGADCGSIMLLDKNSNRLSIKVSKGLKVEDIKDVNVKMGEGIAGWVAEEKQPLFLDDKTEDISIRNRLKKPWLKSSLVVPLQMGAEGDSFGVMNVSSSKDSVKFTRENGRLLENLTKLVGIAVDKSGWRKV